jgi:uncharacterized protein YkwD
MPNTFNLRCAALAVLGVLACAQPAFAGRQHRQITLPCVQGVTCPKPSPCPNADAAPTSGNLAKIEQATLCLVNRQRTAHHRSKLHLSHPLRSVARKYARQMVRQRFFDHVSPAGTTFVQRIEHSTYLHAVTGAWTLGENLAWGEGSLATPRQIVREWMHSPGHRRNILDPSFTDAGMGVALGVPVAGSLPGATYANEFGHKG